MKFAVTTIIDDIGHLINRIEVEAAHIGVPRKQAIDMIYDHMSPDGYISLVFDTENNSITLEKHGLTI